VSQAEEAGVSSQAEEASSTAAAAEIPEASGDDTTIIVGASPSPHAEILEQAKQLLADKG
jgi:D-methionine transport system substrate-binding protein